MWPAIVGAGIAGISSLVGGGQAQRAARIEAQRNRDFQERMRSTQWQAGVKDMEAAGINPALAYQQGPAASPGGSMAGQQDMVTPAVSSAMQAKRLSADLKVVAANASKTRSEADSARSKAAIDNWTQQYLMGIQNAGTRHHRQPIMEKIDAEIYGIANRARREGAMADTIGPLASLARAFTPLSSSLSQASARGFSRMDYDLMRKLKFEAGRGARAYTRPGRAAARAYAWPVTQGIKWYKGRNR